MSQFCLRYLCKYHIYPRLNGFIYVYVLAEYYESTGSSVSAGMHKYLYSCMRDIIRSRLTSRGSAIQTWLISLECVKISLYIIPHINYWDIVNVMSDTCVAFLNSSNIMWLKLIFWLIIFYFIYYTKYIHTYVTWYRKEWDWNWFYQT